MKEKAFTLAEMMVVMLILSIFLAAMTPVITKRLKHQKTAVSNIPSGTIVAYYGTTLPADNNWVWCNGQNGTPDLQGRFIRGASSTYPLGSIQDSMNLAHIHGFWSNSAYLSDDHAEDDYATGLASWANRGVHADKNSMAGWGFNYYLKNGGGTPYVSPGVDYSALDSNGDPTGASSAESSESRPINIAVNYIMKK